MNTFQLADSGPWSLGTLIAFPLCALVAILLIAAGVAFVRFGDSGYGASGWPFALGCWFAALVTVGLIASPLGMYPYDAEYHQFREASGTVEKVDSRLIQSGEKGTATKFVVRFAGESRQFSCDDTRCAQVEVGDALALSCKRAWQYTGTDGYDCRFVSTEAAR